VVSEYLLFLMLDEYMCFVFMWFRVRLPKLTFVKYNQTHCENDDGMMAAVDKDGSRHIPHKEVTTFILTTMPSVSGSATLRTFACSSALY
jgi:hypothetical protein